MTEKEFEELSPSEEESALNTKTNVEKLESGKNKRKKHLSKEAAHADKRGVCYLSRVPPHMNPLKLRQILSQYGEIQRIYLTPENPASQAHRKRAGGFRGQEFSEGWVEFTKKSVAKKVANMLNGEQIAFKNAVREQKLAMEISTAKRERDFYLSKTDKSRALINIKEWLKKKVNHQDSGRISEIPIEKQQPKVVRQFPQKQPVADTSARENLDFLKTSWLECLAHLCDHHPHHCQCNPNFVQSILNFLTGSHIATCPKVIYFYL